MSLPLPDNKRPIEVGDISFVYHGVYHPILWDGEDPYRPRVETLILKDGKFLYLRKYKPDGKFKFCYRIPGGSMDNDSDSMQQAKNEVYEESLIKLSNIYDTNIQYFEQYEPGFLLKNGDICIEYKGTYNRLYTGVFKRKLTDKEKTQLDHHDLDNDMASEGKFYYIPDVLSILRKQHVDALLSSPDVDPDIKTIVYLKMNRLPMMEGINSGRKPVYVVSMGYKSLYGSIVRAYTESEFNHSALALDNTLTTMYTYSRPTIGKGKKAGLNVETKREILKRDPNTTVIINECWLTPGDYDNLKNTILDLRKSNTKYNFGVLIDQLVNNELQSEDMSNDNLVCSVFVGKMLNDNGVVIDKPINLITPADIADLPKLSKHVMPYYYGKLSDYKLKSEFHHKDEDTDVLNEGISFFPLRYSPVLEAPSDEDDEDENEEETTEESEDEGSTDYTEEVDSDEPEDEGASDYTEDVDSEEFEDDEEDFTDYTADVDTEDDETEETEEVPKEDSEPTEASEEGEESETTDVAPTSEEPSEDSEIPEDDLDSTDYTDEIDTGESEETTDDAESGEETTDESGETEEGETGELPEDEEATDYTADVSGEGETEEGEESTEEDTTSEEETSDDTEVNKNSIIKNYNLLTDYQKIYMSLISILGRLESVIYKNPMQNDVLARIISNLQKIKGELLSYIEMHYSKKYEENLYYYSIFIQAIKLNLDMLRKTDLLEDGD